VLDELTRHAVAAWLAELAETAEPSTVGTRLRGMRRFCRWLVAEGELEVAPTDGIEIPSPPDKPVPILTDEEIAALLNTCTVPRGRPGVFDRTVFLGRRDEVVLRLLLDTGVRVSELCGLELTDVDLDRELAYVTGKGSRPRVVPFGAKTVSRAQWSASDLNRLPSASSSSPVNLLGAASRPDDPLAWPRTRRSGQRPRLRRPVALQTADPRQSCESILAPLATVGRC
jgi:site-specific recombinase XerD